MYFVTRMCTLSYGCVFCHDGLHNMTYCCFIGRVNRAFRKNTSMFLDILGRDVGFVGFRDHFSSGNVPHSISRCREDYFYEKNDIGNCYRGLSRCRGAKKQLKSTRSTRKNANAEKTDPRDLKYVLIAVLKKMVRIRSVTAAEHPFRMFRLSLRNRLYCF